MWVPTGDQKDRTLIGQLSPVGNLAEKISLNWRIFSVHNIEFPNVLISICLTL